MTSPPWGSVCTGAQSGGSNLPPDRSALRSRLALLPCSPAIAAASAPGMTCEHAISWWDGRRHVDRGSRRSNPASWNGTERKTRHMTHLKGRGQPRRQRMVQRWQAPFPLQTAAELNLQLRGLLSTTMRTAVSSLPLLRSSPSPRDDMLCRSIVLMGVQELLCVDAVAPTKAPRWIAAHLWGRHRVRGGTINNLRSLNVIIQRPTLPLAAAVSCDRLHRIWHRQWPGGAKASRDGYEPPGSSRGLRCGGILGLDLGGQLQHERLPLSPPVVDKPVGHLFAQQLLML